MIEFLIHAGAQVNYIPDKDAPAIVEAARYGCTKNVMTLIHHQSHVNLVSPGLKYTYVIVLMSIIFKTHSIEYILRIIKNITVNGFCIIISACLSTALYLEQRNPAINVLLKFF